MRKWILVIVLSAVATVGVVTAVNASMGTMAARIADGVVGALGPTHSYIEKPAFCTGNLGDASTTCEVEAGTGTIFGLATLYISLTDSNDSTTAFAVACTGSRDNNSTDYRLQSCTESSGVCTLLNASWSKDPSGISSPKRWIQRIDLEGVEDFECTITDTSGAAADTFTIDAVISTKGG